MNFEIFLKPVNLQTMLFQIKLKMKYSVCYVLLFLGFQSGFVFSQDKGDYKKKFTEGSFLMLEENYHMALINFLNAYKVDSSGANINYKIGLCYLKSASQKRKAEAYLEKAILKTSKAYDDIEPGEITAPLEAFYYLAQAQLLSYKLDEALANFEKYKTFIPPKKIDKIKNIDRWITMCKNAKEFVANPTKVLITNMGDTINTPYPDFGPVISADESILIFSSRREGSTGGIRTVENDFFEDIYISHKKTDGTWSTPEGIDENINTFGHEAAIGLSADGQQLLIYKDDNGDGNIYTSTLEGDRWSIPTKMGSNINSKFWEPHGCISADGNTFYFVSDRTGGYGGRDIYKCVKLPNGQWSLAKNLGPTVNTEYDEDGVFIHPDQVTLFFSSNGHNTMGGFDIFFTSMSEDGKWSEPTNVGYPVNTTDDDIFYVSSTDGKRAYYSSLKEEGKGEKDIYLVSLEDGSKVQAVALLVGRIIVPEGEQLPSSNEIIVTNVETGQAGTYKANTKTGKYVLSLVPGKTYEFSFRAEDKEFYKEIFTVPAGADYQEIEKEVPLKPIMLDIKTLVGGPIKNVEDKKEEPVKEKKVPAEEKITVQKEKVSSVEEKTIAQKEKKISEKKIIPLPEKKVYSNVSGNNLIDAVDDDITVNMSQAYNGASLMNNDKFPADADMKVYRGPIAGPSHGMVSVNNNGEFVYTPNKNYVGSDSFTYKLYVHGKWNKYSDTATVNITIAGGQKLYYDIYFKYNVYEIDPQSDRFNSFVNEEKSYVDSKGKINLIIESSASKVPTRMYKSNDNLAKHRANEAKEKLLSAIKAKGVDISKVNIEVKTLVQGPDYQHDFDTNKATYEKFQYIKIYPSN